MIKCKNFFGTSGSNGSKSADVYFNEWIKAHQDIDILEFRYQQAIPTLFLHRILTLYFI